jgi:hypothetical protein
MPFSLFQLLAPRRRGKQERQSQALMEHLRLALRMVIGQACEIAAAFQDIGLGCDKLVGHRRFLFRVYHPLTIYNGETPIWILPEP